MKAKRESESIPNLEQEINKLKDKVLGAKNEKENIKIELKDLKEGIAKLARARLCASCVAQYAAVEIYKKKSDHTKELVKKLRERRDYSYKRLRQIEGLSCVNPSGAFYLFPKIDLKEFNKWVNDKEFVIDLLKKTGVCAVYGSGFGKYGENHMRLTFLPNLETLEKVYDLIESFLK